MKLEKTEIRIGLRRPVKLLHVTDTHMSLVDRRDDERKQALGKSRKKAFNDVHGSVQRYLEEQLRYAENNGEPVVHTGDLIDFVSKANVDFARQLLRDDNIFFISGNHEYSQYVGEAWEDKAYRMNSYMHMGYGLGVPMFFNSRIIGDGTPEGSVNIVAADNGYYQFEEWQRWRLEREVKKGIPVILAMHDPLFEQSLYDHALSGGAESAGIVGCDEEHLLPFSEYRAVQQRPDTATLRFIDYVQGEPGIKAILAGHLHYNFESVLPCGIPQYVTGGGFDGTAREVTIV